MIDSFNKLIARARKKCVGYSVLTGVSVGGLLFGSLFLAFKLAKVAFPWQGYLLSVALGVLTGGVLLCALYPTKKRFARALDFKHGLGEKVQTALEFSGQEGAVLELQREQTEEVLRALPTPKKDFKWALKLFLLPLLAVSMLTTSLVVPKPTEKGPATVITPSGEEPFEWDEWVEKDLQTLIDNVKSSTLTEKLKPAYVLLLEELHAKLTAETPPTQQEMLTAVKGGMDLLVSLTKGANSYNAYLAAIKKNKPILPWTTSLATALRESGKAYQKVDGTDKKRFATVQACTSLKLQDPINVSLTTYVDEVMGKISGYGQAEYISFVNAYAAELDELFAYEGVVSLADGEGLTGGLRTLKADLQATVELFDESYTVAGVKGRAKTAFEKFVGEENGGALLTLAEQANSVLIKDYTLYTLGYIFEVAVPSEDEEEETEKDPNPTPPDEDEYLYDGLVLDPLTNTFVSYHDLISRYRETLNGLLEADAEEDEPQMTKELELQIKAFLTALEKKE